MKYFSMALVVFFSMLLDIFYIGGTVYLIGWQDWSKWTMILAIILAGSSTSGAIKIMKIKSNS